LDVIPSAAVIQAEREPALSERSESNGDLARIDTTPKASPTTNDRASR